MPRAAARRGQRVCDRPAECGVLHRAVDRALERAYRRLVSVRNPDVLAVLRRRFDAATAVESFGAGLAFVARVATE